MQLLSQEGHIRADHWLQKKKQSDSNVTKLIGEAEEQCDVYLLQTDQLVTKIDGLLTLYVHITSVPIGRCSLHTLRLENSATSKVIG